MGPELKAQGLILSSPSQGVQLIFKKFQYVPKTDGRTLAVKSEVSSLVDIHISLDRDIQDHFPIDFYQRKGYGVPSPAGNRTIALSELKR